MELQVRRTLRKFSMVAPGDHVLVAVSGGADSTALLHCLHRLAPRLHLSLTVAHLNHRIRGREADEDEDFVRRMSADLNLPFVSEAVDLKRQAAETKQNLEDLARRKRYEFLRRTARNVGAGKIAVGHTLDDQAETVLFRFIRGSGVEGLSAIHPVVDGLILRPLLECPREQVLTYLRRLGIPYREDSSNADLKYSRNRIRRELIPYLQKNLNPRLVWTLGREAELAREISDFLQSQAKEHFQTLSRPIDDGIAFEIKELLRIHPALQRQVVRCALKEALGTLRRIGASHIESIVSLCAGGKTGRSVRLPLGASAVRQFDRLLILAEEPSVARPFHYEWAVPGRCIVPEIGRIFTATKCSAPGLRTIKEVCSTRAFVEPAGLPGVLTIRSRLAGDRYGGSGHRKVKKMLIDRKIPVRVRSTLPMVVAGNDVIWIPGFRPARNYEARPESANCLMLECEEMES
jgi:tRNA(Ile)-lysidine synthase